MEVCVTRELFYWKCQLVIKTMQPVNSASVLCLQIVSKLFRNFDDRFKSPRVGTVEMCIMGIHGQIRCILEKAYLESAFFTGIGIALNFPKRHFKAFGFRHYFL